MTLDSTPYPIILHNQNWEICQISCNIWSNMDNNSYPWTWSHILYRKTSIRSDRMSQVSHYGNLWYILSPFCTLVSQYFASISWFCWEHFILMMECSFSDSRSILHDSTFIRTYLAWLVCVSCPMSLPLTPFFLIVKMVKCVKYIDMVKYGKN